MTDLIARATREVCGAGGCERTALLQELHARERIIEDLVQALYALNAKLERPRAEAVRRTNMRQFWRRLRPACTLCRGAGTVTRITGDWTCWRCHGSGRRWFWEP